MIKSNWHVVIPRHSIRSPSPNYIPPFIRKDRIDVRSDQAFNYGCHSTETFHWVHLIAREWVSRSNFCVNGGFEIWDEIPFPFSNAYTFRLAFGEAREQETFRKWMTATWFHSISITVYFWLRQKRRKNDEKGREHRTSDNERCLLYGTPFISRDLIDTPDASWISKCTHVFCHFELQSGAIRVDLVFIRFDVVLGWGDLEEGRGGS